MGQELTVRFVRYYDPQDPQEWAADWLEIKPSFGTLPGTQEEGYQAIIDSLTELLGADGWQFQYAYASVSGPQFGTFTPTQA
jgi:hypothetical protein